MYPHFRSLMPNLDFAGKVTLGMFSYGFVRGVRCNYPEPYDALGYRISLSVLNGVFYLFPPYGCLRLIDLVNRVDVKIRNKDPEKYKSIYWEGFGIGYNKNIF